MDYSINTTTDAVIVNNENDEEKDRNHDDIDNGNSGINDSNENFNGINTNNNSNGRRALAHADVSSRWASRRRDGDSSINHSNSSRSRDGDLIIPSLLCSSSKGKRLPSSSLSLTSSSPSLPHNRTTKTNLSQSVVCRGFRAFFRLLEGGSSGDDEIDKNVVHTNNINKNVLINSKNNSINPNDSSNNRIHHFLNNSNSNSPNRSNKKNSRGIGTLPREKLTSSLARIRAAGALRDHLGHVLDKNTTVNTTATGYVVPPHGRSWITAASNRKRAFLLLDLGGVVRARSGLDPLLRFHRDDYDYDDRCANNDDPEYVDDNVNRGRYYDTKRKSKIMMMIKPSFRVSRNPDKGLLTLLLKLGVDLRCSSSADIMVAKEALIDAMVCHRSNYQNEVEGRVNNMYEGVGEEGKNYKDLWEKSTGIGKLVDDSSTARKPDGYLRRILSLSSSLSTIPIVVDGSDEVRRVTNTSLRFERRRNRNDSRSDNDKKYNVKSMKDGSSSDDGGSNTNTRLSFILRLPPLRIKNRKDDTIFIDNDIEHENKDINYNKNDHVNNNHNNANDNNNDDDDDDNWIRLARSAAKTANITKGTITGIAVDLSPWTDALLEEKDSIGECNCNEADKILRDLCIRLTKVIRLLLLNSFSSSTSPFFYTNRSSTTSNNNTTNSTTNVTIDSNNNHSNNTVKSFTIDLSNLPHPLTPNDAAILRRCLLKLRRQVLIAVEKKIMNEKKKEGPVDVMERGDDNANKPTTANAIELSFTADLGDHLVAVAGALCARVIGVKRVTSRICDSSCNSTSDDGGTSNDGSSDGHVGEEGKQISMVQYYIDDGCYGSLAGYCPGDNSDGGGGGNSDNAIPGEMNNKDVIEDGCDNNSDINGDVTMPLDRHCPVPLYGDGRVNGGDGNGDFSRTDNAGWVRATVW